LLTQPLPDHIHGQFGWIDALPPALRRLGPPRPAEWSLPPSADEQALEQARQADRKAAERGRAQRRPSPVAARPRTRLRAA